MSHCPHNKRGAAVNHASSVCRSFLAAPLLPMEKKRWTKGRGSGFLGSGVKPPDLFTLRDCLKL